MASVTHFIFLCSVCEQEKDSTELFKYRSPFPLCQSCAAIGKHCCQCGKYQLFSEFALAPGGRNRGGVTGYCKVCKRLRNHAAYNPAKERTYHLRVHFDLTDEEYNEMFTRQGGLCALCQQPEKSPDGKTHKVRALAVDHNHETDKVRQLLCSSCNYWLGAIEKNYVRIKKMIEYLDKHS